MQAPDLVDPNTATRLDESADIIAYLHATYGGGRSRWGLPGLVDTITSAASAVRLGRGGRCRMTPGRAGLEPLLLSNMEGSSYCRKVRAVFSELDLFKQTFRFTGGEITGEFLLSTGYLPGAHERTCPVFARIARRKPPWMKV